MPASKDTLVNISEASHLLGVTEHTLRQWTDEGSVHAFVTPGGHRRYSVADLKKFINLHQKMLDVRDLANRLEGTIPKHRELDVSFSGMASWRSTLGEDAEKRFASLGRRLLGLIIKYINKPANQDEVLSAIKEVGSQIGELTAKLELPLIDAVQAFTRHRGPIVSAASELANKGEVLSGRVVKAIPLIDRAMDEALVSLVTAHQKGQSWKTNTIP
jgi:excisionase family DNA binding protein